jgi:hypothetical protein
MFDLVLHLPGTYIKFFNLLQVGILQRRGAIELEKQASIIHRDDWDAI